MLLYIMRHAWAGEFGDPRYPSDRQRPLTTEGKKRFAKWLKYLDRKDIRPTQIFTSPYMRCAETAELWQAHIQQLQDQDTVRVTPLEELGCGVIH